MHDIALQSLPVKMFIDRAGLALADGATHHGIFDVAFLSHIPEVEILAPSDYESLRECVRYAYSTNGPVAVRYPNASESELIRDNFFGAYKFDGVKMDFDPAQPPMNLFITYGHIAEKAIEAKRILSASGVEVGIILVEKIKPYTMAVSALREVINDSSHIVYVEEGIKTGGAAMITRDMLFDNYPTLGAHFDIAAIDDSFASPNSACDLYDYVGLSTEKLTEYFLK